MLSFPALYSVQAYLPLDSRNNMSVKRSRSAFEVDLNNQDISYIQFGTPVPTNSSNVRDDGSYVPIWQQEVRDEQGRKRLHGAFTGGFSAGYTLFKWLCITSVLISVSVIITQ